VGMPVIVQLSRTSYATPGSIRTSSSR
jgi:hypothetical protein